MKKMSRAMLVAFALWHGIAAARGVTPYLPLNLEPEIERQIERVLILGDKPILTRPIAAATVLDALPKACAADAALCERVRHYLQRYMRDSGITHASLEAAATSGADRPIPNQHGLGTGSSWEASAQAYFQPNDYLLASIGGVGYSGRTVPSGSMLSFGISRAQLDVGYRDHWLSPMTDSSMLPSTEAPTMPSVTLSNYEPFTRLGLQYEAFIARMSHSDHIEFQDGLTSGDPRLAGLHLAMEPASGWAFSVNRVLQYGGGARDSSLRGLFKAFFKPGVDHGDIAGGPAQLGNQQASYTSRFLFPGRTPFAVYFEYAGEDSSNGGAYLLGNSALSAGIHFPRLWKRFELTYEVSEWQNAWYVHHTYLDGMTNKGLVLGHWGADDRVFNDGVGAQSHMLRMGWEPSFGGTLELTGRTLENAAYSPYPYQRAYDTTLRYSRPWKGLTLGAEAYAGRDVFGEHFSRVGAFVRYLGEAERDDPAVYAEDEGDDSRAQENGTEVFVDGGGTVYQVRADLQKGLPVTKTSWSAGPHFALGARRPVSDRVDLGARLELDRIDGHLLMGVRALDYRYRFAGPLALSVFLGAVRYDLATPAFSLYGGVGAQWRNVLKGFDLGLDLRYAQNIARDHLAPSDPQGVRPDSFYKIPSVTLSLSRKF